MESQQVFVENFRLAFEARKEGFRRETRQTLTLKRLADSLEWTESQYRWLRNIASQGIAHVTGRHRKDLEQLARELNLKSIDAFWEEESVRVSVHPTWDEIIALGIEAYAQREKEIADASTTQWSWNRKYADPEKVKAYLISGK